ncbi:MAG: hypothetical protein IPG45_13685 [Deltaproteobacteria bacterium]|nr:hypothetical protein [Deltaproteobacteria bacterium]
MSELHLGPTGAGTPPNVAPIETPASGPIAETKATPPSTTDAYDAKPAGPSARAKLGKWIGTAGRALKKAALIGAAVGALVGGGLVVKQMIDHAPRSPTVPIEAPTDLRPPTTLPTEGGGTGGARTLPHGRTLPSGTGGPDTTLTIRDAQPRDLTPNRPPVP